MSSTTALHVAAEVLQIFRQLCAEKMEKQDVPPNMVVVFAEIAANPDRSLREYQEATGLGQAVMSRSVAALGRGNQAMGHGLGLVTTAEDPTNYSRKIVSLTLEGKELLERIDEQLGRFVRTRPAVRA
jgi:DNA-binding MarR family transcriptional regulator